jgi:hypothetical protein
LPAPATAPRQDRSCRRAAAGTSSPPHDVQEQARHRSGRTVRANGVMSASGGRGRARATRTGRS